MDDFGYGNSFLAYAGVSARFDDNPLLDPLFNYKNEYFRASWILMPALPVAASSYWPLITAPPLAVSPSPKPRPGPPA